MLRGLEKLGNLSGKTILALLSFDVPVKEGKILPMAQWRIEASLPFLKTLSSAGARTILFGHVGRPEGKPDPAFSTKPIYEYLKNKLGEGVYFCSQVIGPEAKDSAEKLKEGEFLVLENVRYNPGEKENNNAFSQELASLGEVYINNDFADSHRAYASVVGVAKILLSAAGPLLEHEVAELDKIKSFSGPDLVLTIGGAKGETKTRIIDDFIAKGNQVLAGGAIANTFFKKKGMEVGASIVGNIDDIKDEILEKVVLPVDVVVSKSLQEPKSVKIKNPEEVERDEAILDIGPETVKLFSSKIMSAKMAIWNGPMGLVEIDNFRQGSLAFAKEFVLTEARTIVGGGDVVTFISQEGLVDKINHVSTGGGAMLSFLAGDIMPGLEVLGYYKDA